VTVLAAERAENLPAVGQLVVVRGRHWVVSDVLPTALPFDLNADSPGEGQTFVTLSSVEGEGLGEEIRVLWELEPGRRILERATLPDVAAGRFDDLVTLGAFLDALRWGAVTNAETTVLQAPFRAGIAIEDYQLDPVVRALSMPRVNLLVADDVGLGKTIEAGLVVQEMLLRHRARRVMVVCPATLTVKWQDEMARRFGLSFVVVDTDEVRRTRRERGLHANPFRVHPHTIISLQWLRGDRCQRLLGDLLGDAGPRYPRAVDLLIVDEAHHCAPPGKGLYAVDSQQTRAVSRLCANSEHRLFLSATPHNGYLESWTALLAMLDPQRFIRGAEPDKAALKQILVRRLKTEILNPDGTQRYPDRLVDALTVEYPEHERQVHALLKSYTETRRERVAGSGRGAGGGADLVTLLLKKRLFSSPAAFTHTFRLHLAAADRAGDTEDLDPDWLADQRQGLLFGEWGDEDEVEEAELAADDAATRAAGRPGDAERGLLARLAGWVDEHGTETDAKARALINYLVGVCKDGDPDGRWNDERLIVFTEYRDTQRWLAEVLERYGLADGGRLELLYGGMDDDERERIKGDFQKPPGLHPVRILLATDTASEGIDLQDHCHRLVNYDIPFNPNRLEQRAGRIDRYGQHRQPEIWHFVGSHWTAAPAESADADLDFLTRVAMKLAAMREDLGDVNPVVAAAIERRMLGRPDPAFTVEAVKPKGAARGALKVERQLREDADRLRATLEQSKTELHSSPGDVERVVQTGLRLGRQAPLAPETDERSGQPVWRVPTLTSAWARTTVDLHDRDYGQRPVSFDPAVAASRQDVVLAHLNHPLVAMATSRLRSEVWGTGDLARVASVTVADRRVKDAVLAAYSRLVLVGADSKRLHEEVFPAGGLLRGSSFARLGVTDLATALDAAFGTKAAPAETPSRDRDSLVAAWPKVAPSLDAAITARASERRESLQKALQRREDDERDRTVQLFDQFEQSLRAALTGEGARQLSFADLDADERRQIDQDRSAWQRRLDDLPAERDAELAALTGRYKRIRFLVFPAAVVHIVPARSAR
jgi:superfamily II DNA or RNA helicase